MAEKIDILAIGDVTGDVFIRLKDADVHCGLHRDKCELSVGFGEKIPYEFAKDAIGGNSANAAVAASRLGLSSSLLSYIGDDENGGKIRRALEKEKVGTAYLKIEKNLATNYHYILWYEEERTILTNHSPFSYSISLEDLRVKPKWIYFSSIPGNATLFYDALADYLLKNPEINLCFQPGTLQVRLGYKKLKKIYEKTKVFISNKKEAKAILNTEEDEISILLKKIHELGPEIVVITEGPKGAYALDGENGEIHFMPPYPDPKPPYERTGAGDAFSATFVSALTFDKTIPEALGFASINSMNVVQYIGAQEGLLTREKLEEFLTKAPKHYKPKKIN